MQKPLLQLLHPKLLRLLKPNSMKVSFLSWEVFYDYSDTGPKAYWHPFFTIEGFFSTSTCTTQLGLAWFKTLGIKLKRGVHFPPRNKQIDHAYHKYKGYQAVQVDQKITLSEERVLRFLQQTYCSCTNLELIDMFLILKENMP